MSRRRGVAVIVAVVVLAGTATAAPGYPERSTAEDRNDVRGRFDASMARYFHEAGEPPVWKVRTYTRWSPRQIWDAGFIWIELDTRFGDPSDYYVLIRADRSAMRGALFGVGGTPDPKVTDLRVWRPSPRMVAVRVPLSKMAFGEGRTTFRWWVVTSFVSDVCPRTCFDMVPDHLADAVAQDAPGGPPPP